MSAKTKFWLCALLPFLFITISLLTGNSNWLRYDLFYISSIIAFGVAFYFQNAAFDKYTKFYKAFSFIFLLFWFISACIVLGSIYYPATGSAQRPWLAAMLGNQAAQIHMGDMQVQSADGIEDPSERLKKIISGMKWYDKTATLGCPYPFIRPSAMTLGLFSNNIFGKNPIDLLTAVANEGEPLGAYGLGLLYDGTQPDSRSEPRDARGGFEPMDYGSKYIDNSKAKFWYLKAAELGEGDAIKIIASRYREGWPEGGMEKDAQKAAEWENKIPSACRKQWYTNFRFGHYDILP